MIGRRDDFHQQLACGGTSKHPRRDDFNPDVMTLMTFPSDGRNQPRDDDSQQRVDDVTSMESHGFNPIEKKSRTPNESEVRHIATATKVKAVDPSVHFRTDHNSRNGFNAAER